MRVPTLAGQYRHHKYTDDGCDVYTCNWCEKSVEVRGDPIRSGWNFCPKCGKSWFTREQCRSHDEPRWVFELGGDEWDGPRWVYKQDNLRLVIEERTKWPDNEWGDWHFESSHRVNFAQLGIWRDMKYYLETCRRRVSPEEGCGFGIEYEYRARLERV